MNLGDPEAQGEIKPSLERASHANIAPTTTAAQDRIIAGQQNVNLMWENTQRIIALSVTWAALVMAIILSLVSNEMGVSLAASVFLFGVANLVIGFYFGRTNHQRTGGAGPNEIGR